MKIALYRFTSSQQKREIDWLELQRNDGEKYYVIKSFRGKSGSPQIAAKSLVFNSEVQKSRYLQKMIDSKKQDGFNVSSRVWDFDQQDLSDQRKTNKLLLSIAEESPLSLQYLLEKENEWDLFRDPQTNKSMLNFVALQQLKTSSAVSDESCQALKTSQYIEDHVDARFRHYGSW